MYMYMYMYTCICRLTHLILAAYMYVDYRIFSHAFLKHATYDGTCMAVYVYIAPGAYEPPEGQKERPTLHYSVERHLILNAINTSLIWPYPQVVMSGVESVVFIANAHRVYVYSTLQQLRVQARVRRCASSSLDVLCGVVACRFRSHCLAPSSEPRNY